MSISKEYVCDTCRSNKLEGEVYAVVFQGKSFRLKPSHTQEFREHEGVHVCETCWAWYKNAVVKL